MVVDEENEVADWELGEIVLRGENILKGYYKNEDATARAFRNGWFHTGDVGYRDGEGFFYIVDRKSDMIIRGGENIYPREIDEVLYQHPAVAAAATIGVPDQLYGEEVAAFVVLKEGEVDRGRAHRFLPRASGRFQVSKKNLDLLMKSRKALPENS